jgi:probable DNA repair protein
LGLRPLFSSIDGIAAELAAGTAVLTPNRRLSRAVREAEHRYRQTQGEQSWTSSTVMPLRQFWIERWQQAITRGLLPPASLLDISAQRLLWRRIIENEGGFSLLSPGRAAVLCQEAAERLALWQLDLDGDGIEGAIRQSFSFDEDARAFLRWEAMFRDALLAIEAITPEMALRQLLNCPAALDIDIALLDPDELPPLHAALCANARSCRQFSSAGGQGDVLPVQVFADPRSELQAAARWCKEQVSTNPEGRFAVVLADMQGDRDRLEYFLRREFDCLTSNYERLPVNFATGFSLERVPLVRDAMRILELGDEEIEVESAIALLHSRFVRGVMLDRERRESGIRRLRELARERIPARVLRGVLDQIASGATSDHPWNQTMQLATRGRLHRRRRLPSQWLEPFRALLEAWGWPRGLALDSLEFQQATQWQEALELFARLDPVCNELGYGEALQRLRELLSEQQFQPRTEDSAIQILGPLETTGLHFDAVWVTGMSANHWPANARPNPYLPHRLQRDLRMPHASADWEWEWAQRRWSHWLKGADKLQASFVNLEDGAEVPASPLIREIPQIRIEAGTVFDPRWGEQATAATFAVVDAQSVPLTAGERAAGGVGAQVLEQQALCPFQAYAATRLSAAPMPGVSPGLLATERGSLMHRALYQLWGTLKDSDTLASLDASALDSLLDPALDYAEQGLKRERVDVLGTGLLSLERERLKLLIKRWIEIEVQRPEAFVVSERETQREYDLAGLRLRLRLDRVDRLSDGSELILDYKSAAPESLNRWMEERPTRPQLPLYALLDPPAGGIAFASLKPGKMGFKGIGERSYAEGIEPASQWGADTDAEPMTMAGLRAAWQTQLSALASEFLAGESAVNPTIDACRYCQRQSLCRLGEELE